MSIDSFGSSQNRNQLKQLSLLHLEKTIIDLFSKYGEIYFRNFSLSTVQNVSECFSFARKFKENSIPQKEQIFTLDYLKQIKEIDDVSSERFQNLLPLLETPIPLLEPFDLYCKELNLCIHKSVLDKKREKNWIIGTASRICTTALSKIIHPKFIRSFPIILNGVRYALEDKISNILKKKIEHISSIHFINAYIEKAILNIVLTKYRKYIDSKDKDKEDLTNFLKIFAIFLSRRAKKSVLLKLKKQRSSKHKTFNLKIYRIFLKNLNEKKSVKYLDLQMKREMECQRTKALLVYFADDYLGKKLPLLMGLEESIKFVILTGISELYNLLCCQTLVKHWIFKTVDSFADEFENTINDPKYVKKKRKIKYSSPLSHIPLLEKATMIRRWAVLSAINDSWVTKTRNEASALILTVTLDPFKHLEKIIFGKNFNLSNTFKSFLEHTLNII